MKILIILLYYNRPKMVLNALNSIIDADKHHQDWHLAIVDDSSPQPIEPIARDVLKDVLHKVSFYHTNNVKNMIGEQMNNATNDSDADIGIMLCDDDALCPTYLADLSGFYTNHPDKNSAYCKLSIYSPAWQTYKESYTNKSPYNKHNEKLNPSRKLDSSQVSWRTSLFRTHTLRFPEGITKNLDAAFYHDLNKVDPDCTYPMDVFGQYKGMHPARLFNVELEDIWAGKQIDIDAARQLGGVDYVITIIDRCVKFEKLDAALRIATEASKVFDSIRILDKQCLLSIMVSAKEQN